MPLDLEKTAIFAIGLYDRLLEGERHARECLQRLTLEEAELLQACLRRLGWWLPDDEQAVQDRLAWWLFRTDVKRTDFKDGEPVERMETVEERMTSAKKEIAALYWATVVPAESCLSVAGYVRQMLDRLERKEFPYGMQIIQCGTPDEFRFDISRIHFDGELLHEGLNAAAQQLGLPPGRLEWQDTDPYRGETRAFDDLKWLLKGWRDELEKEIQKRGELPPGWEPREIGWPESPIRTVEDIREWLKAWLQGLHDARATSSDLISRPASYLDDFRRELRNSFRASRAWGFTLPQSFNDNPADIFEAEKQLSGLIDGFHIELAIVDPLPDPIHPPDDPSADPHLLMAFNVRPSEFKAYQQYRDAVQKDPSISSDYDAYRSIKDHLDDGETIPSQETWTRYVRKVRQALGEQKNKPRGGRTGRSIVQEIKPEQSSEDGDS